jgi:hypothetical protein
MQVDHLIVHANLDPCHLIAHANLDPCKSIISSPMPISTYTSRIISSPTWRASKQCDHSSPPLTLSFDKSWLNSSIPPETAPSQCVVPDQPANNPALVCAALLSLRFSVRIPSPSLPLAFIPR